MNRRPGCGACCIAPSISSPIPGMPHGKAVGVVKTNGLPLATSEPDANLALWTVGQIAARAVSHQVFPPRYREWRAVNLRAFAAFNCCLTIAVLCSVNRNGPPYA